MRLTTLTMAAAALAFSACAPNQGDPPDATPKDQIACEAQGGDWRREGLLGEYMCVLPYADAGEACTDGDQCDGDCRLEYGPSHKPGTEPVTGVCQANSSPFVCFATVEDGRVETTICVD